jgi:hypothetical protein
MYFVSRGCWHCQFLEDDLKTPLPRQLSFSDPAKIYEMAERARSLVNLESKQALDHAIRDGRGGIYLQLTEEQYRKLRKP